jgi:amino acid adenylation domain-containing protein/thioester reductase-like protein
MKEAQGREYTHEQLRQLSLAEVRELWHKSGRRRPQRRLAPLLPQLRGGALPLSYAQERLWFLDQLGFAGAAYNSQMAVRLDGELNLSALQRSLADLVRRHESLRTRFEARDGLPVQIVAAEVPLALQIHDLAELSREQHAAQVMRLSEAEMQRPFDLARAPLLRVTLVKFGASSHVLVMTMHHIVTDGWSWQILNRELSELYGAHSRDRPASLPDLPVQYADYAIWQRQWLQGELLQRQLSYWREHLKGAPAELALPTDRPRPPVASFSGARLSFDVSANLRTALDTLARREGVTLFMLILAAYEVLLARYSGETDIVVGCPIAGRSHAQTEGLVGFFVNTLALRADLSGNPGFRELLQRVKEATLQAYANQDLPFEKLVTQLHPERNLARQPLCQVALSLQNYPQESLQLAGLTWTPVETERVMALFDLTLHVLEAPEGLRAAFVYARDLFDADTIERMAGHFVVLLESLVTDPDCRVRQLPLLTTAERSQIVNGFNDTRTDYPHDRAIHQLFEQQASRAPQAPAVIEDDVALTYLELNSRANQLAHLLLAQGVQSGDHVPIVMPRSLQLLIAQLAVLKCGGAYIPIDPSMPRERQLLLVRDCGAHRVLGIGPSSTIPEGESWHWIDCAALTRACGAAPAGNPDVPSAPLAPAYVMYTSGSTGMPKGVVVPHRAVNKLVRNTNYVHIVPSDRIAHCSNPAFDASTFEIWGALLNGAAVVIVPQAVVLEAQRFAELLSRSRVTVLWLTVGLFSQYAEVLAGVFGQLRYLFTGGDVVEPAIIRRVLQRSPPRHLMNAYGPTECTTFTTTYEVDAVDAAARSIPIGRPISNTQVYILDEFMQPVPVAVAGEMYIGGDGVALGYLNRPDSTRQRFVANPFACDPDARLYRTGDLARWRAGGVIEFVGRGDQQVKVRGFRVEPGEIEAHLARHVDVNEAVVVAQDNAAAGKQLVAYVTGRGECTPTAPSLRSHLARVLPEYMLPSAFVVLESLPLTANGKIDRRALPAPGAECYVRQAYEAPRGAVEQTLASIWEELLQVEHVSRQDDFFGLGGHSLLVLQAVFRIQQRLGCAISARDVYRSPTLGALALRIAGETTVDEIVDLSREAVLNERIVPAAGPCRATVAAVLLTGATGFVGRFILAQLLRETTATIYCMVRAPSTRHAMQRLRTTLQKWDLWRTEFEPRIVPVVGDLRRPGLGIDEQAYCMLAERVDSIYHCATSMNHLETYGAARAANVASVAELLRLATSQTPKLLNYISTLSVFRPNAAQPARVVHEGTPIDGEQHPSANGYAASKWVAEKIFALAQARGVPCNIFRLGLVWADSEQGRYDELQREYRVLKSCLLSGYGIAGYRHATPPTPIDYVARSVVFLASRHPQGGGMFHLSASRQPADGLFERCNAVAGTSLELLPYYAWICEMKRLHLRGWSLPAVPLIEYAFSMNEASFDDRQDRLRDMQLHVDCSRTCEELEQAGIVAPFLDDDLLRSCLESMCARDPDLRGTIVLDRGKLSGWQA